MVIPVSIRENHPNDQKIISWYRQLVKSEKSREIRKAILSYIDSDTPSTKKVAQEFSLEKVSLSQEDSGANLDDRLDIIGIGE